MDLRGLDFSQEIFIQEALQISMATFGGVRLADLQELPFTDYELVIARLQRLARELKQD